jgi:hypothetical protein
MKPKPPKMTVTDELITTLVRHPMNARVGDMDVIRTSMRTNGWFGVVVAQTSTRHILVGNHRVEAWALEGHTTVPVQWIDCDDQKALRILTVDNRSSDLASFDETALAALLSSVGTDSLGDVGYTEFDLLQILDDANEAQKPKGEPKPTKGTKTAGIQWKGRLVVLSDDELVSLNDAVLEWREEKQGWMGFAAKWPGYNVPMGEAERAALDMELSEFVEENGLNVGFIHWLLNERGQKQNQDTESST